MKKFFFLAMMLCAGFAFTSCDDDDEDENNNGSSKTYVVTFEGDYFNKLIDTPQNNGPLLYNETEQYGWMDIESGLNGVVNGAYDWYDQTKFTYMFWNGGTAISNYIDADYANHGTADYQLSVPVSNKSKNFVVAYCPAEISLADGKDRQFLSMDICPTTYLLGAMKGFNSYASSLEREGYLTLVITATSKHGEVSATGAPAQKQVRVDLARDGKIMDKWTTIDLSSLGEVYTLSFSMEGSDCSDWGVKHPQYFAFDNVVIKQ